MYDKLKKTPTKQTNKQKTPKPKTPKQNKIQIKFCIILHSNKPKECQEIGGRVY